MNLTEHDGTESSTSGDGAGFRNGRSRREQNKREAEKCKEENIEHLENMTSSELISLVQCAPALRRPADVARASDWFRRKADSLRKLEPRTSRNYNKIFEFYTEVYFHL